MSFKLLVFLIVFSTMLFGGHSDNHLEYSIPVDAKKTGPFPLKTSRGKHVYRYYSQDNRLIGIDIANEERVIESILIKDHERHGVHRVWNQSGILVMEEYYNHGVMHGIFRCWDNSGKPTGNWEMKNGTGKKILFYPHGSLKEIIEYKNSQTDGLVINFYENGKMENFGFFKSVDRVGDYYEFGPEGKLTTIQLFCGPQIRIDKHDNYRVFAWCVHGKNVSFESYKAKLTVGAPLFPLCLDYSKCLDLELAKIDGLLKKYNSLPLWSIPSD